MTALAVWVKSQTPQIGALLLMEWTGMDRTGGEIESQTPQIGALLLIRADRRCLHDRVESQTPQIGALLLIK